MLSQQYPSSSYGFSKIYTTYNMERRSSAESPSSSENGESYPKNMCPAQCKVCGGQATGYHYEVPSCNGCKTFFRRTVLSKKQYKCKREGNCTSDLTKKKQHWCRGCRFQKCVEGGMNPLAISSQDNPSDNEVVKAIIRKRGADPSSEVIPRLLIVAADSEMERIVDALMYLEVKKENFRKCKYNPDPKDVPLLNELINSTPQIGIADKVGPMLNWPLSQPKESTVEERVQWRKQGLMFRPFEENRKNWIVYDMLTTVEYAKTFPFFNKLTQDDRLYLLKSVGLICHNLTQAFFSFENKSDIAMHPDGTYLPVPPKEALRYQAVYNLKKKIIQPLIRNQVNKKEYVLLKALMLCNSGLSDLSNDGKQILQDERRLINKALLHVTMSQRGKDGPARYASNLSLVHTIENLTRQQKDIHLLLKITSQQNLFTGLVAEFYES